jgi:hypothetical protein
MNLSDPNDPLLKALNLRAQSDAARYVRGDMSTNKSRVLEDLVVLALHAWFTGRGDPEGLKLIMEHEDRRAAKQVGSPLLSATTITETPTPKIVTMAPTQATQVTSAPVVQLVKPKKRIVDFYINESGHSRVKH